MSAAGAARPHGVVRCVVRRPNHGRDWTVMARLPPAATLRKIGCDVVLRGEPDQTLSRLASEPWEQIPGCCFRREYGELHISAELGVADMRALSPLDFHNYSVEKHSHRHHVFTGEGRGAGARVCARVSVGLQLLQQDFIPRQISRARCGRRAHRSRSPDGPRCGLHLFHR